MARCVGEIPAVLGAGVAAADIKKGFLYGDEHSTVPYSLCCMAKPGCLFFLGCVCLSGHRGYGGRGATVARVIMYHQLPAEVAALPSVERV